MVVVPHDSPHQDHRSQQPLVDNLPDADSHHPVKAPVADLSPPLKAPRASTRLSSTASPRPAALPAPQPHPRHQPVRPQPASSHALRQVLGQLPVDHPFPFTRSRLLSSSQASSSHPSSTLVSPSGYSTLVRHPLGQSSHQSPSTSLPPSEAHRSWVSIPQSRLGPFSLRHLHRLSASSNSLVRRPLPEKDLAETLDAAYAQPPYAVSEGGGHLPR